MHKIKRIHFVGIGGTGMNGIAQVLLNQGYTISGSDLSDNPAVQRLHESGARIFIGHAPENIEHVDVVVTSTAVNEDNPEVVAAREAKIPVIPRAEMLAELMRFQFGIAVAGTHGKTTTTSLVASILAEAGLDPTYVIGGKLNSSGSNAKLGKGKYFVAEADESDASFLYLQPTMAIVTNIDVDHMETYGGDIKQLHQTFVNFLHHLPFYGTSIMCIDDEGVEAVLPSIARPTLTYGFSEVADVRAVELKQEGLTSYFKVQRAGHETFSVALNLPGRHNVLNALAAIVVAMELGVETDAIMRALSTFQGVGRRCQFHGDFKVDDRNISVFEDYGHHPRELVATQEAMKSAFPDRRLVTVFQPHRYSRTKDLFDDFVNVLSDCDGLVLLDVYSAGEMPIVGADSRSLAGSIRQRKKVDPIFIEQHDALFDTLTQILEEGDVVVFQGAGDVGSLFQRWIRSLI